MKRMPVDSSNLKSVGYDSDSEVLEIEFKHGAVYQYERVPQSEYDELMRADSKGTYFNTNIRKAYSYRQV